MKNIHILPTDKGTGCLAKSPNSQYYVVSDHNRGISDHIDYNIYITSDEEINQQTEPCWCINTIKNTWDDDLIYYQGSMPQYHFKGFKKIILTTDQDLIKDGIQSIDDEFLEWFVKNPSCEYIKTEKWLDDEGKVLYSRIIPKEEPKQTVEEYEQQGLEKYSYEPKQETLEEHNYLQGFINQFEENGEHQELSNDDWTVSQFLKWMKLNNFKIIKNETRTT